MKGGGGASGGGRGGGGGSRGGALGIKSVGGGIETRGGLSSFGSHLRITGIPQGITETGGSRTRESFSSLARLPSLRPPGATPLDRVITEHATRNASYLGKLQELLARTLPLVTGYREIQEGPFRFRRGQQDSPQRTQTQNEIPFANQAQRLFETVRLHQPKGETRKRGKTDNIEPRTDRSTQTQTSRPISEELFTGYLQTYVLPTLSPRTKNAQPALEIQREKPPMFPREKTEPRKIETPTALAVIRKQLAPAEILSDFSSAANVVRLKMALGVPRDVALQTTLQSLHVALNRKQLNAALSNATSAELAAEQKKVTTQGVQEATVTAYGEKAAGKIRPREREERDEKIVYIKDNPTNNNREATGVTVVYDLFNGNRQPAREVSGKDVAGKFPKPQPNWLKSRVLQKVFKPDGSLRYIVSLISKLGAFEARDQAEQKVKKAVRSATAIDVARGKANEVTKEDINLVFEESSIETEKAA